MTAKPSKILIVGPAWVGDMVMAQSLFKWLKQHNPEVIIDVLAPEWTNALVQRMPEVNQGLISPFRHGKLQLLQRHTLGRQLCQNKYRQAIVLPNSFKAALVPFWAKIPLRTGWRGECRGWLLNDVRHLNKNKMPRMVERFVALGLPDQTDLPKTLPQPSLKTSPEMIAAALQKLHLSLSNQPVLALCPGAEFGPSKRWPPQHFAAVANAKIDQGWQVWIFGSKQDHAVGETIKSFVPANKRAQVSNLAGQTTLPEAIDLLSLATAAVSNDSGLMHIAAALQRPLVAIYGSSSPHFTPPLTEQVRILSLNLPCSPCFERECPLQHLNCLTLLQPEQVLASLDDLVKS